MKRLTRSKKTFLAIATVLGIGVLLAAQPATAAPPVGRTYFVVSLGVGAGADASGAYDVDAGCLRFGRDEVCETDGDCGIWWPIEGERRARRQMAAGFEFFLTDDETGLTLHILGRGRIDSRGPRSSLAAVAHAVEPTSGVTINFAIAGRAVGPGRCERLEAEFLANRERAREGGQ